MSLNKPIWKLRDWINIENLYLDMLSYNKNAVDFHCKSKLKFDKNIFDYLENPDKINWYYLSFNKNAIKILEENPDKINWKRFSENSSIFELDYEKMRENNQEMYEDLIKEVMKPSRVFKNPDYDYLEELFGD